MNKIKVAELEEVSINRDYEKFNLKKGQRGIVVMIHDNRNVEFGCCMENKLMLVRLPMEILKIDNPQALSHKRYAQDNY